MFIFVAYKPDSVDNCMGCRVGSYSSDHTIKHMLTTDALVDEWAVHLLKDLDADTNEVGYYFWIFKDGIKVYDEWLPYWDSRELGYSDAWLDEATCQDIDELKQADTAEIKDIYDRASVLAESMKRDRQNLSTVKAQVEKKRSEAEAKEKTSSSVYPAAS